MSTSRLFQKVGINIVNMQAGSTQYQYLVLAQDDLSRRVKGRALWQKKRQRRNLPNFYTTTLFVNLAGLESSVWTVGLR